MDQTWTLPRLYAIADTGALARCGVTPLDAVEQWLEAGIRLIQLRHKGHFGREMFETAKQLSVLCRQTGARFLIDDRADLARILEAGVHVGQDDLPPADARAVIGANAILGFSTHNESQLAAADREPADYLAIGPIFSTGNKQNPDPVVGIERLPELRRLTAKPLVAIGGITRESAPHILQAGIDCVAVIGDLLVPGPRALRTRAEQWLRML